MKLNTRRGGFTLVEIMIVVAIIALLATIAVPSFMRSRLRSQATLVKNEARLVEAAKDQWAMEKNKKDTDAVGMDDLIGFFKTTSKLYTEKTDSMGGSFGITTVGAGVTVSGSTKALFSTVTDGEFWSPY